MSPLAFLQGWTGMLNTERQGRRLRGCMTQRSGIVGKDGKGLAAAAPVLNGDGLLDIYVANRWDSTVPVHCVSNCSDSSETDLAIPQFEERGTELGAALAGEGRTIAGMGIAHGDYDRDGWLDLYITNFYLEPHIMFRNLGGLGFNDVSTATGLGPATRLSLAFGCEFLDVDHDGWLDLFVKPGRLESRSSRSGEPYRMRPHLFRNERKAGNGRFTDVAADSGEYFRSEWLGRAVGIGDLDRDGDVDLVVSQQVGPSVMLLNETPAPGTSVVIKPVGRGKSPRSGIGTRATARGVSPVLMREVAGGGSFQTASALELHFGMNDLAEFDQLDCTWPDGQEEQWRHVGPGYYVAIQGRGLVRMNLPSDGPGIQF